MLQHVEKKTLPFTQKQMFDLVADVESYNEFAPWCISSRINKRDGDNIFYADLVVGYNMLRECFSSKVVLEPNERLTIEYLSGPLKHLRNEWQFIDNKDGSCTIDFSVEFEFRNFLLQALAKKFFNEVIKRMVSSFEKRAHQIYTPVSAK